MVEEGRQVSVPESIDLGFAFEDSFHSKTFDCQMVVVQARVIKRSPKAREYPCPELKSEE